MLTPTTRDSILASRPRRWPAMAAALLLVSCGTRPPPTGDAIDHPPDPAAPARAGQPLPGLTPAQLKLFDEGKEAFAEIDTVDGADDTSKGLGPRFNLNSCAGCHAFPAVGGSSGFVNLEPIVAHVDGATNAAVIPFVKTDGPVVEARFKWQMDADGEFLREGDRRIPDGGVHALFTIEGRHDAPGCILPQPPFERAWQRDNVSLRIPTPTFGLGLIEAIDDSTIAANSLEVMSAAVAASKDASYRNSMSARIRMYRDLGIAGRPGRGRNNRSGNDGTITRFGWKAQNKSLLLFSGEAYNVEQGVTNELFPNERDAEAVPLPDACKINATPEDDIKFENLDDSGEGDFAAVSGDLAKFELFMRLLAPPPPACDLSTPGSCAANIVRGSEIFDAIYCSVCHVRRLPIGTASIAAITAQEYANLYSDLLLHRMGRCSPGKDHAPRCLADEIEQGQARGDEFRTAPLWGVGQRVFFMHDGRSRDLPAAIRAHKGPGSEANEVVRRYEALPQADKQDLIDFLRTL